MRETQTERAFALQMNARGNSAFHGAGDLGAFQDRPGTFTTGVARARRQAQQQLSPTTNALAPKTRNKKRGRY